MCCDDNGNITNKLYSIFNEDNEYGTIDIMNLYDSENRIVKSGYNDYFFCYEYDSDGQLIRADHEYFDNFTATYSYDSRGNVTAKSIYACTHDENITLSPIATVTFTYANSGWKDQLIAVNGVELTYDEIGNVLTYGNRLFTWNSGRNLQKIVDGDNEYTYTYDENGIRTSKTVNGVTTYYNTKDGVILSQSDGTNTMYFQYDTSGKPFGFVYNGTQYFYLTNQMGDVIAVIDVNGYVIGEYVYDEWGNQSVHVTDDEDEYAAATNANPLRYRGYYYDVETRYYYLQSRYYDPSICRFINADIPEIAQLSKNISVGTNLFAYCCNNPINHIDNTGEWLERLICGLTGAAVLGFLGRLICSILKLFVNVSKRIEIIVGLACAALGAVIGAILGVRFLTKYAPRLLKAIQQIEKKKFSIKAIGPNKSGNIFGIIISGTLIIMLHAPHPSKREWYYHIQVEAKFGRKQIIIYKKPIYYVDTNWRWRK